MNIARVELSEANDFVSALHRHHKKVTGHRFSIGASKNDRLVGVAICGRPVARRDDQKYTLEVTRLCTDGTPNACSFLYSAAARIAKEMGFRLVQTFILEDEPGTSLVAAGWKQIGVVEGRSWSTPSRLRTDKHPTVNKTKWAKELQ